MDNLAEILRRRNIFGSEQYPMDEIPRPSFEPTNQVEIQEEPQFKTDALNRFLESIQAMPQRENFKPSGWRKVGAGIVGAFKGGQEGNAFLNRPYNRELEDWGVKNKALGQAAQFERLGESAESQAQARQLTDEWRRLETERKAKEGEARIKQGDERIALENSKLEVQRELLNGGTVQHDEVTGKTYLVTKRGEVKEIPINSITEAEKVRLATEGRLKVVAAQGQNAKEVAAIPRTVNTSGTTTTQTVDPNAGLSGLSPQEDKVKLYNSAQRIFNTHPEWREYIKLGQLGSNEFTIEGADEEIQKKIIKELYPDRVADISLNPSPGKTTTSSRQSTSVSSKGESSRFTPKIGDQVGPLRKLIPGTNKYAVSHDGGKTWKAE